MRIKEIAQAITKANGEYGFTHFGVRTGRIAEIGEELERSHNWNHEDDCFGEDFLPGTCATGIGYLWYDGEAEDEEEIENAIAKHKENNYDGEMTYIIAGKESEYGEDDGELIIKNATVICIID